MLTDYTDPPSPELKRVIKHMEENNVLEFKQPKLKLLGNEPPSVDNWLSEVEDGALFLVRQKGANTIDCQEYRMIQNLDDVCLLHLIRQEQEVEVWVHTVTFSRTMQLEKTLGKVVVHNG